MKHTLTVTRLPIQMRDKIPSEQLVTSLPHDEHMVVRNMSKTI